MLGTEVPPRQFRGLLTRAKHSPRWLEVDAAEARAHYNKRGFLVRHRLAEHPLFELAELFALCRRAPQRAKHRFGVIPHDAHFDTSLGDYRKNLTLDDAIDRMVERRAYIAIFNPETDPKYRPVIEGLLGELGLALHEQEPVFNWYSTYIFVSAQDSITPYHQDREMNFLLQIRGTKTVQLWDAYDDSVIAPADRDYMFSNIDGSEATYRDELAAKCQRFDLAPGLGVHHPFIAPHLVTTGPEQSISLAITFRTPASDRRSDIHRFDHRARELGLGRLPIGDAMKAGVIRTLRKARAMLRR